MEAGKQHMKCNDCGCRFEAGSRERDDTGKKPVEPAPPITCPQCASMNITTA